MPNALLTILAVALSATAIAANIVDNDSVKVSVSAKESVQVKIIETSEACVFTFDPQWADDEDTSATRVIFDNFKKTDSLLKKLKKDGFTFEGYQNKESCEVGHSTFPEVLTRNDNLFFARFVSTLTMVEAAREQKAFKKVRRVYVRGLKSLQQKVNKELSVQKTELLKKYL